MSKRIKEPTDIMASSPATPSVAPKPLEPNERIRLFELESIIAKDWKRFVKVANAVAEIKESHIYRGDYKSFGEYCLARWKWG